MEQRVFAKPAPAKPLEESDWLDRTDRAEVGREPFFYGRDTDYEVFQKAANSLRRGLVGGGTMVFQGAPGAGKSALMLECMEAVRQHSTPQEPWVAASVAPGDLISPAYVMSTLIRATDEESKRLSSAAAGASAQKLENLLGLGKRVLEQLSNRGFTIAGISVGGKSSADKHSNFKMSVAQLFRQAAPLLENIHFIVFVDEAQNTPVETTTRAVLDCLHRDPQGINLVAAFFGLSDTVDVLRKCGLSRLALDRVVNLEPLGFTDAACSFRRMIDTYYSGSDQEKDIWADALAELSQGWPQHINRIGVAAGQVIRDNGGKLRRSLLGEALEKGTEKKNDYYDYRIAAGYRDSDIYVELAVAAGRNPNGLLSISELRNLSAQNLSKRGHRSMTSCLRPCMPECSLLSRGRCLDTNSPSLHLEIISVRRQQFSAASMKKDGICKVIGMPIPNSWQWESDQTLVFKSNLRCRKIEYVPVDFDMARPWF